MDALDIQSISKKISDVEERIFKACSRSGRQLIDVNLIAVTKYGSLSFARQLLDMGIQHIGENRWQDAKPKWEALHSKGIWHFLGHLQTNKAREVVDKFTYIHSLDRLSLAQHLEKNASHLNRHVNVFIQVNIAKELSKFGLDREEVKEFIQEIRAYDHLKICGLMTMAPYTVQPESTRPIFRQLRELRDELNQSAVLPYEIEHLSMGMSNDFEIAIEEGATWIRLGSVLMPDQINGSHS